ncbi:MAG: BON domain-containing protein [Nocardioidaceae bacterium]
MTQTDHRPDIALKSAIIDELRWTPSIDPAHIGISVNDGAVTLSGEVESYPEKLRTQQAVQRVRGVHAIAQEMTVRSAFAGADDADIAREAGAALDKAVDVPDGSVEVSVHDHVVTLTGAVPWHYQRESAARSVHYLSGVNDVRNLITIKPVVSTTRIKNAISQALVRNALLEAKECTVTADLHGAVTLEGTVTTWSERHQTEQVAWAAPGVTAVHNLLRVES